MPMNANAVSPAARRRGGPTLLEQLLANPVIGWIGQSNAVAATATSYNVGWMAQHLGADLLAWDPGADVWVALEEWGGAGVTTGGGVTGGGQIAPLFMRRIADATGLAALKLIALAYTSQGTAYFEPDSATPAHYLDGTQHATLNNFNLFNEYASNSGLALGLIVRIQGEADGGSSQAAYFASLSEWIDAMHALHPHAGILIVLTNETNVGETNFTGVRAAQQQAADTYSFVEVLDTSYMTGRSSLYGGANAAHYASALGYEELAEMMAALVLRQPTRPQLADVDDLQDIAGVTWIGRWRYVHQATAVDCDTWQSNITGTSTALTTGNAPKNIRNAPDLGNRLALEFDRTNSERKSGSITATSSDWTVVGIGIMASLIQTQNLAELNDGTPRLALQTCAAGLKPAVFRNGASTTFSGAPDADQRAHVWVMAQEGNSCRLYIDGVLVDTPSVTNPGSMSDPAFHGCSLVGTSTFHGQVSELAVATGAADDDVAAAIYAYAVAEYGDVFGQASADELEITAINASLAPRAWWRADRQITTPGAAASALGDLSVSGTHDLTQGTGANQPAHSLSGLGGRQTITYDAGDFLTRTGLDQWKFLHDGTGMTLAFVFTRTLLDARLLLSTNSNNPSFVGLNVGTSSFDRLLLQISNGSGVWMINQGAGATDFEFTSGVLVVTFGGTAWTMRRNGVQTHSGGLVGSVSTANHQTNIALGNRTAADLGWGGQIPEALIFDRVLDAADLAEVEDYLMTRYGL